MYYICNIKQETMKQEQGQQEEQKNKVRNTIATAEFKEFLQSLDAKTKEKFAFIIDIIETQKVIIEKYAKHLTGTEFYELRVSVGFNEYRSVIFTMDAENLMEATEVILVYSFQKKSTKDYKKAINKARNILHNFLNISEDED